MAKKLGEILLERGVIGPKELKKALDAQLIFGGRLGTNLIELGFVDEATIAEALEDQQSTGVATPKQFRSIPAKVLRVLPESLAERHKVVPLAADENTVTVAMQDPSDLVVLDEIAFVTGKRVEPLIAPEARLIEALETYYGVRKPVRFVSLSEQVREEPIEEVEKSRPWAVDMGRPEAPGTEEVLEAVEAAHEEDVPEEERSRARATLDEIQKQQRESERRREEATRAPAQPPSLDEVAQGLARAQTRDDIGEHLLDYAAPRFERCGLFLLQKARTLGWMARGEGVVAERIRAVVVPRDLPSVFDALVTGTGYYLGEVEELPGNELLLEGLGGKRPQVAFLMPVPFQDRHVAALYGDGPLEMVREIDVGSFRSLVAKAGLALEMLLLRHRILQ